VVNALFTYATLATLGGAAFATALAMQVVEESATLRHVPRLLLSWVAAVAILAAATGFQTGLHVRDIPLLLLNGLLIGATSVGARHAAITTLVSPSTSGSPAPQQPQQAQQPKE